ncbi:MAG: Ig-like domain-containing protein [Gemmatimonadetes bacterium]|nr:Ig-like domain-containing protein [Gemmatimonadota bacterium]
MKSVTVQRAWAALVFVILAVGLAGCGGDGTAPETPHAASITLSQSSVSLTYLGQMVTLKATVLDQSQKTFLTTVSWASSDPSVATVSSNGAVTAVANGTATVTAAAENLTVTATVTVQQVATRAEVVSGNTQTGTVGQPLAEPIVVRAVDQGGSPVVGAGVTFAPGGDGSVSVVEATTGQDAGASTVWTLGTTSGTQQLTAIPGGATAGQALLSATALADVAAGLEKVSGDGQTAPVSGTLTEPVVVKLTDAFGNAVAGDTVVFAVTGGGGSVTPFQAATGSDGMARATWTMGSGLGANTLSATVIDIPAVEFTATASAPKADLQPSAIATSPVNPTTLDSVTVSATVTNIGYLAAAAGVQVELMVDSAQAGTSTLPALAVGESAEVMFTVGPLSAGSDTLRIVVDPNGTLDEWSEANNEIEKAIDVPSATPITAGTPVPGISGQTGTEIIFTLDVPASAPGTVEITLSGGTGDVDLYVNYGSRPANKDDYKCQSGNPTTSERCVINAAEPGTYYILLYAFSDFSGTTLLAKTGLPIIPYNIELAFIHHGTSAQDTVFQEAADAWMQIIPGDISDFDFSATPVSANACIQGQPLLDGTVDDLRIYVDIDSIDGPGKTLAQAGPCIIRGLGDLPVIGVMQFDSADMNVLSSRGDLLPVVKHEMGHVLGIGSIWDLLGLLHNPSLPASAGVDTYFSGARAIAAFDAAGGGTIYTLGNKVPVENTAKEGSADGHWRESVLGTELMTPYFNSGQRNPLSAISIESLADLGYTVDVTKAEPFSAVYHAPARVPGSSRVIDLGHDVRTGPVYVVDPKGRLREVMRR